MSVFDRAFGAIRSAMLMSDQFEAMKGDLRDLSHDVTDLGRSHADLAQRVARLEGFIEGAAAATGREPRLPKE